MPLSLAQLVQPYTPDQVKAILLQTLQGVGPVIQTGTGAGSGWANRMACLARGRPNGSGQRRAG